MTGSTSQPSQKLEVDGRFYEWPRRFMVAAVGPAVPFDIKRRGGRTVGRMWPTDTLEHHRTERCNMTVIEGHH